MFTDYASAEFFLLNRLPVFTKNPYPIETFKLEKVSTFLAHINNPQQQFKSIHVGGTNGKGSVSHLLAAAFQQQGYQTGLYTSPHLIQLEERIKINGIAINKPFILNFVNQHFNLINELSLSFFEVMVVLGFVFFAQQKIDIAIIEVGLGGRLDSTNIISPIASVITNISLEHTQWLGNTLEQIAAEKAGIIKPHTPVIIGEYHKNTLPVFQHYATQQNAPLYLANSLYELVEKKETNDVIELTILDKQKTNTFKITSDLIGSYQFQNICTALACLEVVNKQGIFIEEKNIHIAFKSVKSKTNFLGRWDIIQTNPLVIADVAHNAAGIEQIVQAITSKPYKQIHFIMGMVQDKNHDQVFALLPQHGIYYFTQANIFRSAKKEYLQSLAVQYQLQNSIFDNVNMALEAALKEASQEDLVVICGSVFLIAELNFYTHKKNKNERK